MLREPFLVSHATNLKMLLLHYEIPVLSVFLAVESTERPTKQRQNKTKAIRHKTKAKKTGDRSMGIWALFSDQLDRVRSSSGSNMRKLESWWQENACVQ